MVSLAAVNLAVVTSALAADEKNEARDHYIKGTKAFELGAYDEAITEYSAAYRIKDDPALLYNLGQAHRLASHPIEALRFYRLFLMKTHDATNRSEVEQKIAELQKLVDQQKKAQNLPPDQPPESSTPATPPTIEPKAPTASAEVTTPAPARTEAPAKQEKRRSRAWVWGVVAGAVAAVVAVGVGVGLGTQPHPPKADGLVTF